MSISLDQQPRVLYNLFYCIPKLRLSQYIKTKLQTTIKLFWKIKRGLETCLPASFSAWFLKKNIPIVMFYYLTNFHCLLAFTSWDIGQFCIVITPFFINNPFLTLVPKIVLAFLKNRPKKLFSNCLVDGLLTSIFYIFKHSKCCHSLLQEHLEYLMHTF